MKTSRKPILEEIQGTFNEIVVQVKKLIREGNARRIIIKNKKGKTLFQSQLTVGVAGTAFLAIYAPILTALTTFVLVASDVQVFVEKEVEDDNYEVEADIIEVKDEEEDKKKKPKSDKTVGKKEK